MAALRRQQARQVCAQRFADRLRDNFTLQARPSFVSLSCVRWLATIFAAILSINAAQAQHQERSLTDRLLRPDMGLQNKAQNKKFSPRRAIFEQRGTAGAFYVPAKPSEKKFSGAPDFSTSQFHSWSYRQTNRAETIPQNANVNSTASYSTSSISDVRTVLDSQKAVGGRQFADNRSFLDEGKSQKALKQQNPPLTIDQVRELLNKNK